MTSEAEPRPKRHYLATSLGDIHRAILIDDRVSESPDPAIAGSTPRSPPGRSPACATRCSVQKVRLGRGPTATLLSSEAIAAVAKVMTLDELSSVARAIVVQVGADPFAIGGAGHFGSRLQPNSPGDDEREILFWNLEGLAHGCGDVIIGLNPAAEQDLDAIVRLEQLLEQVVRRLELPTRFCVLSIWSSSRRRSATPEWTSGSRAWQGRPTH